MMKSHLNPLLALSLSCLLGSALSLMTVHTALAQPDDFTQAVNSFTKKHCLECHDVREEKGDFRIDSLSRDLNDPSVAVAWQDAIDLVALGEMPPEGQPRPSASELKTFLSTVQAEIRRAAEASKSDKTPSLRRLSHTALDNTVRDLLLTRMKITDDLPDDPEVAGFDNMAATMGQSSEFMKVLQRNARRLAEEAIVEGPDPRVNLKLNAKKINAGRKVYREGNTFILWGSKNRSNTVWPRTFVAPRTGVYRISFDGHQFDNRDAFDKQGIAYGLSSLINVSKDFERKLIKQRLPQDLARQVAIMAIKAPISSDSGASTGGRQVGSVVVNSTTSDYELTCELEAGENFFVYAIDCPRLQEPPIATIGGDVVILGEQLHLTSLRVEGPLVDAWPTKLQQQLLTSDKKISRDGLLRFLTLAFRHPVDEEILRNYGQTFNAAIDDGHAPEAAARLMVEAALCSPRFLYIRAPDANEEKIANGDSNESMWSLASRLSYFLWNTMPDVELLRLAASGELRQPEVIEAQVRRMIADERSDGFVTDFTGQWLGLRKVGAMLPDPKLYPCYDLLLENSMRAESESLFREILKNNLPITDFIAPQYAMLNERLAMHYGIDDVTGAEIRRVSLPADSPRGGVLGHASMLTITSNGTRTSPVVRGVWVLENLFDSPPSPPPPDVEPIEPDVRGATTIREMLAKHRDIETCNECHRRIDPWGFGLENFDAIGAWRETYGKQGKGKRVDSTGQVAGGKSFDGIVEMRTIIVNSQSHRFKHALAAKLLAHANGHPATVKEEVAIADIVTANRDSGGRFADLIVEICQSPAFVGN